MRWEPEACRPLALDYCNIPGRRGWCKVGREDAEV